MLVWSAMSSQLVHDCYFVINILLFLLLLICYLPFPIWNQIHYIVSLELLNVTQKYIICLSNISFVTPRSAPGNPQGQGFDYGKGWMFLFTKNVCTVKIKYNVTRNTIAIHIYQYKDNKGGSYNVPTINKSFLIKLL